MKSFTNLVRQPLGLPLVAEDILELHAARILLLCHVIGGPRSGRIEGLTKMAKLDFFVRYPDAFHQALAVMSPVDDTTLPDPMPVESPMIRYNYGPWDERYNQVLSYLEAKGLMHINREKTTFSATDLKLTDAGKKVAKLLCNQPSFEFQVQHMKNVKLAFGKKSGTSLKEMVYSLFPDAVGKRSIGEVIEL